jgi:serine/threonine protein kinase
MIDKRKNALNSSDNENKFKYQLIKDSKYVISSKILGKGSFGTVYIGYNKDTKEKVAIKREVKSNGSYTIRHEYELIKEIEKANGTKDKLNISPVIDFIEDKKYYYLIMKKMNYNLNDIKKQVSNLDLESICSIGKSAITILEKIHKSNIIHRDLKPDNFMVDKDFKNLYIIDFGLSKKYVKENGEHIKYKTNKSPTGTLRYMSVYTNIGIESSRRDDLISLGYVLIYLIKGELPWQNVVIEDKNEKIAEVGKIKKLTKLRDICGDLPENMYKYLKYCYKLKFEEKPDYEKCRMFLENLKFPSNNNDNNDNSKTIDNNKKNV